MRFLCGTPAGPRKTADTALTTVSCSGPRASVCEGVISGGLGHPISEVPSWQRIAALHRLG